MITSETPPAKKPEKHKITSIRHNNTYSKGKKGRRLFPKSSSQPKNYKPVSRYLKISGMRNRFKCSTEKSSKRTTLRKSNEMKSSNLNGKFKKFLYFDNVHFNGSPREIETMKEQRLAYVVESFQSMDKKLPRNKSRECQESRNGSRRKQNDLIEDHIAMILLNQRLALKADIKRMKQIKKRQEDNAYINLKTFGITGKEMKRRSSLNPGDKAKLDEIHKLEKRRRKKKMKLFSKKVGVKGSRLISETSRNRQANGNTPHDAMESLSKIRSIRERYYFKYRDPEQKGKKYDLSQQVKEGFNFVNMPDIASMNHNGSSMNESPHIKSFKSEVDKQKILKEMEVRLFSRQRIRNSYNNEPTHIGLSHPEEQEKLPLVQRINFRNSPVRKSDKAGYKSILKMSKGKRVRSSIGSSRQKSILIRTKRKNKNKPENQKMEDLLNSSSEEETGEDGGDPINEEKAYHDKMEKFKRKKYGNLDRSFNKFLRSSFNGTRVKKNSDPSNAFLNRIKLENSGKKSRVSKRLRCYSASYHTYLAFYGLIITDVRDNYQDPKKMGSIKTDSFLRKSSNADPRDDISYKIAPDKIEATLDYCIGKGNNDRLVNKTLMKRIGVANVAITGSAQFIWSQKYKKSAKISKLEDFKTLKLFPNHNFFKEKIDPRSSDSKAVKFSKRLGNTSLTSLSKLFNISTIEQLTTSISSLDFFCFEESSISKLKKYITLKNPDFTVTPYNQIRFINHLKGLKNVGKKHLLAKHLMEYCSSNNLNVDKIIPKTFIVSQNDERDFDFLQKGKIYIIKPGEFSNRGKGIMLSDNNEEVRTMCNRMLQVRKGNFVIIQEYIERPLLFNNRKFDLRCYALVVKLGFKFCVYWYKKGYARTTSFDYKAGDLTDLKIHLTNEAVQVKGNIPMIL